MYIYNIVKVPQMFKIVKNGSAAGVSLIAVFLELLNYTITVAHNVRHNNPLPYVIYILCICICIFITAYDAHIYLCMYVVVNIYI